MSERSQANYTSHLSSSLPPRSPVQTDSQSAQPSRLHSDTRHRRLRHSVGTFMYLKALARLSSLPRYPCSLASGTVAHVCKPRSLARYLHLTYLSPSLLLWTTSQSRRLYFCYNDHHYFGFSGLDSPSQSFTGELVYVY
jgi:hypothetical protein